MSQVRQSPQTVQNVVTYDIVLSVDNSDLALKPGMTAAARIIVDQRSDVAFGCQTRRCGTLPKATLRHLRNLARRPRRPQGPNRNQGQVWLLRDGKPTAVPVVLGLDDDSFTEIVSGDVQPGDLVITTEQSTTSGQTATPQLRL